MPEQETTEQTQLETTAASTETQAAAIAEQTFELSKHIGSDGKLLEGWKNGLLPEELKNEKFFDCFTDVQGVLKTAGNQSKMIGRKRISPLTEKSTPVEIEEYRQVMGIPHNSMDYQYAKPEGIENLVDLSPEIMNPIMEKFHAANLSESQVKAVMAVYFEQMQESQKTGMAAEQKSADEAEQIIRGEAGADYDSRLHLANRMITENTQGWSEEKREKMLAGLNDSKLKPYVMDFLANIASNFMEHKPLLNVEDTAHHDLQQEIDELMHTNAYMERSNPDHKMTVDKVAILFQKKSAHAQRTST